MGLLEAQGVRIELPSPGSPILSRVVVAPRRGSPEYRAYREVLSSLRGAHIITYPRPLGALLRAIIAPRGSYATILVGVDPGRECAASAYGERYVVWLWKGRCSRVGRAIMGLLSEAPHDSALISLGSGPGFEEAEASLGEAGLGYVVVDELYTSSRPIESRVAGVVGDRDVLASLTIALRGATHLKP